jgi:hypothetical protein
VSRAPCTIAVLSPAYAGSQFGEAEWRAAFVADPSGADRRLIPVRVAPGPAPGLLRSRVYIDLVGCDEDTARAQLLDGAGPPGPRPTTASYPGQHPPAAAATDTGLSFPGWEPRIANLPARTTTFVGNISNRRRAPELTAVRTTNDSTPCRCTRGGRTSGAPGGPDAAVSTGSSSGCSVCDRRGRVWRGRGLGQHLP